MKKGKTVWFCNFGARAVCAYWQKHHKPKLRPARPQRPSFLDLPIPIAQSHSVEPKPAQPTFARSSLERMALKKQPLQICGTKHTNPAFSIGVISILSL
jgi:hypothetical protein